ncbi:glycosyltransferase family 2 protein [Carnobacterium maltaromaticum]|uniref:glycosyltransferase family 2 protein n=1 Tax=Carnobacterium maltaromaticum TaxID=2751 RepID=UPI0039B03FAC
MTIEPEIRVSIVTYNSKHIFKVLENIREQFKMDERYKFVIFDNNSSEEYKEKLKMYDDIVELVFFDENKGFGFGHNYNLLNATEKYFLVFNPDIILLKESVDKMVAIMEKEEPVSMVVPKVLNSDGTKQYLVRDRVSVFDYALRFIPFRFVKKIFDKRLSSYECRDLSDIENTKITIGSGCFMLIRSSAYKQAGGFDERYFMYFEDYDLCRTINKNNGIIIYTPFSEVTHFYEKGAHKNKNLFKIFMSSMRKFFSKWGWKLF